MVVLFHLVDKPMAFFEPIKTWMKRFVNARHCGSNISKIATTESLENENGVEEYGLASKHYI